MSCAKPLIIPNPIPIKKRIYARDMHEYIKVPCGYCLNCRIDKRNWIVDSFQWYHRKRTYGVGAYITLTYDNTHMVKELKVQKDNTIRFTAKYKDGVNFVKRLREYQRRHKLFSQKLQKESKYLMCTEYGGLDKRPHIHILWLGMDYQAIEPLVRKHWDKGIIKILPIKQGAVRYICKYLEKGALGKERKKLEEESGCEAPRIKHSKGVSHALIQDNMEFILKEKMYPVNATKMRPLPKYYRDIYKFKPRWVIHPDEETEKTIKSMKEYKIKPKGKTYTRWEYTTQEMNDFRHKQNVMKYNKLVAEMRKQGIGENPILIFKPNNVAKNLNMAELALFDEWENRFIIEDPPF